MTTDAEDSVSIRLERLEMTVSHHRELMELREEALDKRLEELKTVIASIRTLIMRGILWGAGGLLVAVCSLIWQRLIN